MGTRCALLLVGALGSTLVAAAADVTVRRGYVDGPFGQVHYRLASPDTRPSKATLVAFHHTPGSSRHFDPFIRIAARDRTVLAFDTPGYGHSDGPAEPIAIEAYAAALIEALGGLGLVDDSLDLLGFLTGAYIATEIAVTRPKLVRKLVIVSSPVWTADERQGRLARWNGIQVWSDDGSYVIDSLEASLAQAQSEPPALVEYRLEGFIDGILPRERWDWAERAAIEYPAIERQPLITQPTLALIMHDFPNNAAHRAAEHIEDVEVVELREVERYAFKRIPKQIAEIVINFLDEPR